MPSSHNFGIAPNATDASSEAIFSSFAAGSIDVFEAIHALDKSSQMGDRARKDGGVVYTPKKIALDMCAMANPRLGDTVLEPSCGRGIFIFALAMHHMGAGNAPQDTHDSLAANLKACDLDADAIGDLLRLWRAFWIGLGVPSPKPLSALSADSLFGPLAKEKFDLSIGNPPYVRFQNLPSSYREKLQKNFATCAKGNVDIFFAFVEQAIAQAKKTCMIFPNSWMATSSGNLLRKLLSSKTRAVIDFGSKLIFDPVRAYVCIVVAESDDRPLAEPILVKFEEYSTPGAWISMLAGDPRLGASQWALTALPAAKPGKTLADLATLYSGIATLADSAYAIQGAAVVDGMAIFTDSSLGAQSIPLEWAPKKAKLTKLNGERDLLLLEDRIFSPYDSKGALVPLDAIAKRSPDAAAFLHARKERLSLRDKGKQDGYEAWHAYGRKQGLRPIPSGLLCAVSIMSCDGIQCFKFDSAKTGAFLFTSGFVLAPKPGHTADEILAALQSSDAWTWMLAHGKAWAGSGGKNYRSCGARLLLSLPIA